MGSLNIGGEYGMNGMAMNSLGGSMGMMGMGNMGVANGVLPLGLFFINPSFFLDL